MVSFQCEQCGDVVTKKKIDAHYNRCWQTSFTCLDCMTQFHNQDWKSHNSCMSEAQKYQGALYKEKKPKSQSKAQSGPNATTPRQAYVEDVPDSPGPSFTTVAKVDVPPRAPSPPTSSSVPVNVFDFLDPGSPASSVSSIASRPRYAKVADEPAPATGLGITPLSRSSRDEPLYTYGHAPIQSTYQRYDSDIDVQMSDAKEPPIYQSQTPAPARNGPTLAEPGSVNLSDKKRKRGEADEAETSRDRDASKVQSNGQNVLHSGLTGGLDRLLKNPNLQHQVSPLSPKKRSKRSKEEEPTQHRQKGEEDKSRRSKEKSEDVEQKMVVKVRDEREGQRDDGKVRRRAERRAVEGVKEVKSIEYHGTNGISNKAMVKQAPKAVVSYKQKPEQSHSEFFLSLIDKGAESVKGQSIWGVLKSFHEGLMAGAESLETEDRRLFRGLRMKQGKNGEVILFSRPEAELEGV